MMNMDSLVNDAVEDEPTEDADEATADSADTEAGTGPSYDDLNTPSSSGTGGGISDEELDELLEDRTTEITVVGCGGAGSNTASRMIEEGIEGADILAANTDVQHLRETDADTKLLIGRQVTGGRGAGSRPKTGEKSALEAEEDIRDNVSKSDMVFVTAGMGGGTGTGAAPVVAEIANEEGALTIAVVTTPFSAEGQIRHNNAEAGLEKLREAADTVIVIPNDRLLDSVGKMPVEQAFKVADEVLMRSVKGITELITCSGLVNLDFADVETVMENGDVALIGMGESDSGNRAEDSIKSALRSPLLDVDISGADSVLVNVTGGDDMAIEEAEGVVEHIHDIVGEDARIIWGTSIDESLGDTMRTMLVVTGVDSPQIYGETEIDTSERDIDYVQ